MKAILLSIKPKWVAKILNGEKTIEVRKTMPKCDLPIDVYIYCTKGKGIKNFVSMYKRDLSTDEIVGGCYINGKVIAKFTLNKVEEIGCYSKGCYPYPYSTDILLPDELEEKSCLTNKELENYLGTKDCSVGSVGYAWHISNLVIFDKPKELSEFKRWVFYKKCESCPHGKCDYDYGLCSQCCEIKSLAKAPQSFCYIESEE